MSQFLGWAVGAMAVGARAAPPGFVEPEVAVLWSVADPTGVNFGWAVADVQDLDNDGVTDVITGDPWTGGYAGVTVVLSGATGAERFRIAGDPGALAGYAVSSAQDVDGDGVHDVLSGAPGLDAAIVYSGATGAVLHTLTGASPGESFGTAVAWVGDVTGDGVSELAIGAQGASVTAPYAGRVYLLSGADGAVVWTADGEGEGHLLGSGAGTLGDVTGDGVPDLVAGAPGAPGGGLALVLDGVDGAVVHRLQDGGVGGALGSFFVAGVGDVDSDGVPDVYGGDYADAAAGAGAGRVTVWSGATGVERFAVPGTGPGDGLGPGRYAGDVNGDGVPDLAAGSWTYSGGAPTAGRVSVLSGVDGAVIRTVTSTTAGENFGFDAIGLGDVDGDGEVDLLVSAATASRVVLIGTAGGGTPTDTGPSDTATTDTATTDTTSTDTASTTTGDDDDDDTTGPDATDTDDSGGCGCGHAPQGGLLALLALSAGVGRRRRG